MVIGSYAKKLVSSKRDRNSDNLAGEQREAGEQMGSEGLVRVNQTINDQRRNKYHNNPKICQQRLNETSKKGYFQVEAKNFASLFFN